MPKARYTQDQKLQMLDEWRGSTKSAKEYAEEKGIPLATLYAWSSKLNKQQSKTRRKRSKVGYSASEKPTRPKTAPERSAARWCPSCGQFLEPVMQFLGTTEVKACPSCGLDLRPINVALNLEVKVV